jgi:hypothetical protein
VRLEKIKFLSKRLVGTIGELEAVCSIPKYGVRVVGNKMERHRTPSGVAQRVLSGFVSHVRFSSAGRRLSSSDFKGLLCI